MQQYLLYFRVASGEHYFLVAAFRLRVRVLRAHRDTILMDAAVPTLADYLLL